MRWFASLAVVTAVAGCGGGGGGDSDPMDRREVYLDRLQQYQGVTDRIGDHDTLNNTAWSAMPVSGSAVYEGVGVVALATGPELYSIFGDARVEADFGPGGGVSGRIDRMFGNDQNGNVDDYDGSIRLHDGRIGVNDPNDFVVDMDGSLEGNGDRIVTTGRMDGRFRGTPIRGVEVDSLPDSNLTTLNGSLTPARVGIIAETAGR